MIDVVKLLHYTPTLPSIETYLEYEVDSKKNKLVNLIEKTPTQLHRIFLNFDMLNIICIINISRFKVFLNNEFRMVAYYNHQRTSVKNFMTKGWF